MARFQLARPAVSHEDLFVSRYDNLLRQAQRLTSSVAEAEDLVQDAFIRFSLTRPDLERLENLDGYLYVVLRNLHLSRVRRSTRTEVTSLSVVEFDSAEIGLWSSGVRDALETQDTLRAVCAYGCERRQSSKSGSLFLLRFFHGAVPTEIARIARMQPGLVDRWLAIARREAQQHLAAPERSAFAPSEADATLRGSSRRQRAAGVLHECRQHIFSLQHASCWTDAELDAIYADAGSDPLSTEILAALVTCPTCLQRVCGRFGIHRLDERFPTDTFGRNQRPRGASDAHRRERLRLASDRLCEIKEHRPRELHVVVNGFVIARQRVVTEVTELTLTVSLHEPVTVVEVLSEQGVCVAFLSVEPAPLGPVEEIAASVLSGGRSAALTLKCAGPWPTLEAVYRDPDLRGERTLSPEAAVAPGAPAKERVARQPAPAWWWCVHAAIGAARLSAWPRRRVLGYAMALLVLAIAFTASPSDVAAAVRRMGRTLLGAVTSVIDGIERRGLVDAPPRPTLTARSIAAYAVVAPALEPTFRWEHPVVPDAGTTAAELTALELRALGRLVQVDAYLGHEVRFSRSARGIIVHALVADERRREVLAASVAPLFAGSPVRLHIETMEAAARREVRAAPAPTEVRSVVLAPSSDTLPAALRDYVATLLPASGDGDRHAAVEREARRFATRAVERSQRASRHAWALKRVSDRYLAGLAPLDTEAAAALGDLLRFHAGAFQQEIALLTRELQPAFFPQGALDDPLAAAGDTPRSPAALRAAIDGLVALDRQRDMAVSSTLSMSVTGVQDVAGLTPAFWSDLAVSARLARDVLAHSLR